MKTLISAARSVMAFCIGASFLSTGCSGPPSNIQIPAGTHITLALTQPLTTESVNSGDIFTATATTDLRIHGLEAIRTGDTFKGIVNNVTRPDSSGAPARITLTFQYLLGGDGKPHPIHSESITLVAAPETADSSAGRPNIASDRITGAIPVISSDAAAGGPIPLPAVGRNIVLPNGQLFIVTFSENTDLPVVRE